MIRRHQRSIIGKNWQLKRPYRIPVLMTAYIWKPVQLGIGFGVMRVDNPNWVSQWKLDGLRLGGIKRGLTPPPKFDSAVKQILRVKTRDLPVILFGRSRYSYTENFPHIAAEFTKLKPINLALDGEGVYLDAKGNDIQRIASRRMRITNPVKRELYIKKFPVTWFVFDVLECEPLPRKFLQRMKVAGINPMQWVDGANVTQMPLKYRIWLLEEIVPKNLKFIKLVDTAYTTKAKVALKRKMRKLDREGVVYKRLDSVYVEGRASNSKKCYRSPSWRKAKFSDTDEVVIIGWYDARPGEREGLLGGFYTAQWDGKQFRYTGKTGAGFKLKEESASEDDPTLEDITKMMRREREGLNFMPADAKKFLSGPETKRAHWIPWRHVIEIKYRERSKNNRFKEAAFIRFRFDKRPKDTEYPK